MTRQTQDLYAVLSIPNTASLAEIKRAYHRTLLLFHPDKTTQHSGSAPQTYIPDIPLIKEAYTTLSTPHLRAQYDRDYLYTKQYARSNTGSGPRPAQVVSLEEFEVQPVGAEVDADGDAIWTYTCRCGGTYKISTDEMEQGNHVVGCTGCSEVVWVGYELADDGTIADAIDDGID